MEVCKIYNRNGKLEFIRYVKGRGIEMFTNQYRACPRILSPFIGWHLGWTKPYSYCGKKFIRIDWSGSAREPWSSWTLRIGRFGIGTRTPKWIQNIISKRNARKWDMFDAFDDDGMLREEI